MQDQKKGTLFVFSGPSGVGKGTLNAKLFAEFGDQMAFSVSATTRAPREGEIDGTHYFFISRQEFHIYWQFPVCMFPYWEWGCIAVCPVCLEKRLPVCSQWECWRHF